MSIASILRSLKAALPIILANAPAVIAAARDVKKAMKKAKTPQEGASGATASEAA
jgi:hypothetical protein